MIPIVLHYKKSQYTRGRYRWPVKLAVNRCECWHFMFVRQSSWSVRITTSWPTEKILKLDSIWQKANASNVTSPFKWPVHDRCASRQLLFEFLVLVRVRVRRVRVEPLPPGGTPLYKLYKYVPRQWVGFLRLFGLKTGIEIVPILVWNRVWFSRKLRECMKVFIVSIPN